MVKLIMHGCNGRMGQVIGYIVKNDTDAEIVAGGENAPDLRVDLLQLCVG